MTESSILDQLLSVLGTLQPILPSASDGHVIDDLLFGSASTHGRGVNSGQLHHLSADDGRRARSVLLTLHVLFPHHLLPAMDLLDRGLVTRLTVPPSELMASQDREASWEVYYIQSSSALTSKSNPRRKKPGVSATFYEVRLDSWNCSCPAFSIDAFQGLTDLHDDDDNDDRTGVGSMHLTTEQQGQSESRLSAADESEETHWRMGGTATLAMLGGTPICKHILAAALGKAAPKLFSLGVTETIASLQQLAGWGGGWGEFGYG